MKYRDLSAEELVRACTSSEDAEAWEEFVRRFHKLVATVALRIARRWGEPSPETVDDLVQETYLKLCADNCRILRNFEARHSGSLYGFLKVLTVNLAQDHFRSERSEKRGGKRGMSEALSQSEVEARSVSNAPFETGEKEVLLRELDASLRDIVRGPDAERDRRIFWLYYRVGLTAKAISDLPSIELGVKGVESTILRLNRLLRERLVKSRTPQPTAEGIRRSESFS